MPGEEGCANLLLAVLAPLVAVMVGRRGEGLPGVVFGFPLAGGVGGGGGGGGDGGVRRRSGGIGSGGIGIGSGGERVERGLEGAQDLLGEIEGEGEGSGVGLVLVREQDAVELHGEIVAAPQLLGGGRRRHHGSAG